jgi:hypothetical protein
MVLKSQNIGILTLIGYIFITKLERIMFLELVVIDCRLHDPLDLAGASSHTLCMNLWN